jgi:hypothetical protein
MRKNIWFLVFWGWLTSLRMMFYSSIHLFANDKISFFFILQPLSKVDGCCVSSVKTLHWTKLNDSKTLCKFEFCLSQRISLILTNLFKFLDLALRLNTILRMRMATVALMLFDSDFGFAFLSLTPNQDRFVLFKLWCLHSLSYS